jgi:hypothetical protein
VTPPLLPQEPARIPDVQYLGHNNTTTRKFCSAHQRVTHAYVANGGERDRERETADNKIFMGFPTVPIFYNIHSNDLSSKFHKFQHNPKGFGPTKISNSRVDSNLADSL